MRSCPSPHSRASTTSRTSNNLAQIIVEGAVWSDAVMVRPPSVTGLIITGLGQVWLHTISNTGSYQVNVLGGIMVTAFGMGLVFPTISVAVTAGVGPGERGLAGGLFVTAQQVGNAIGLAALATIAAAETKAHDGSLTSGYRAAFLVAIALVVLAILIVATETRTRTAPTGTR
jgi:MFS family permease